MRFPLRKLGIAVRRDLGSRLGQHALHF